MEGPDTPVVAVSGFGGRNQKIDRRLGIIAAQHGAAARKEFKGTAASVETRDFSAHANNPADKAVLNNNAETYYLESMGNDVEIVGKGEYSTSFSQHEQLALPSSHR